MANKLSLVMITKNSSFLLRKALRSVEKLVDEIIIVDDYSTDHTVQIAKEFSAKIFLYKNDDLGEQRAYALSKATNDWILILDADEHISYSLKKEIKKLLAKKKKNQAFLIPFQNHLLGRPLHHGGEEYSQLRLFNKKAVQISSAFVHENFTVKKGSAGKLTHKIYHHSYQSYLQIFIKFTKYSIREARQKKQQGEMTSIKKIFVYPVHMFYARFIKDEGYRDGLFRIPLDVAFAYMEFLTYSSMLFIRKKKAVRNLVKIAIDSGDFCPQKDTVKNGITRLIYHFTREFSKKNKRNIQLTIYYFDSKTAKNTRNVIYKKLPRRGFASFFLPFFTLKDRNDIYLSFSSYIPALLVLWNIRKAAFLYDLAFQKYPQYYSNPSRLNRIVHNTIKRADILITLTKFTMHEINRKYPHSSSKLHYVYPGINHIKSLGYAKPKKYFLYVGVIKPIKNVEKLFDCFYKFLSKSKDKTYRLVLVGEWERNYFNLLKSSLKYSRIKNNLIFVGKASEHQLTSYYRQAIAVLNVSYAEGFGFPVLEALSMGKKVIVNDLPIYHEFKSKFDNLLIGKTNKEIVNLMRANARNRYSTTQNRQKQKLSWESFTNKVTSYIIK